MKEGWKIVRLGEVCEVINGYAFDSKLFSTEQGKPLIRIRDIKRGYTETFYDGDYSSEYIVRKGDFLIGMDGEFNIGEWKSEDALLNQRVCKLVGSKEINIKYVYYYIPESLKIIENKTSFATVKHLSSKQIKAIELPLPPLEEQHRIVSILDASFEKIDTLKKNAEENLKNAKALFQQVLAQELKPKEGWVETNMETICTLCQGLAINAQTKHLIVEKSNLPLLRIKDLKDGTREIFIDESNCPENCKVYPNDIIYTRTGTLGLTFTGMNGVMHNNCFKININRDKVDKHYIMHYIQSQSFKDRVIGMAQRAAQPDITHKIFKAQYISYPSLEEQHRIVQTLDTLSKKCRRLEEVAQQTIRECDALKQSILRQAFSGEL